MKTINVPQEKILEIADLSLEFQVDRHEKVRVIESLSLDIRKGETLGLVGESGCGKSVTSLSVMRLLDTPPASYPSGRIRYRGDDLLKKSEEEMAKIRGNQISMIFQEPMTSLNPVLRIGEQIEESLFIHQKITRQEAKEKAVGMLNKVRIPRPEEIYLAYPHELSGGMRQRVMIAIALVCDPDLLIADEPTTALDVTIQAQILDLMVKLKDEMSASILFITHDLGVVAEMCDRIAVMYAGQLVELSDAISIFKEPKHPYTRGLLNSIPKIGKTRGYLPSIRGQVPLPGTVEKGCRFADRCDYTLELCRQKDPELLKVSEHHQCRCWLYPEGKEAVLDENTKPRT